MKSFPSSALLLVSGLTAALWTVGGQPVAAQDEQSAIKPESAARQDGEPQEHSADSAGELREVSATVEAEAQGADAEGGLDSSFFDKAAFVSIDFQPPMWKDEPLPKGFAELGITQEDVDEARRFLVEEALPNARRVADASRRMGLPMIFVHWGYQFADAMDLHPPTYNAFMDNYGPDTSKWPHHISAPDSRPAEELGVQPGEYVIAKTAQDAFASSNIVHVLENLGVENLVFVGGDTGACLGNSARSAIEAGYRVLCVKDATFDASQARRLEMFDLIGCHHVLSADEFENHAERALVESE